MDIRRSLVSLRSRGERAALAGALALPERVQRLLAGRPVVRDGQTLATETQLVLRLQRLARQAGAETMPIPQGRVAMRHHARLAGGDQRIGATRDLTVEGRPARLYVPSTAVGKVRPLLVFFHGGGFMYGDLESHDSSCRLLAERSGVRVLAVTYRLAPEHTFPAAHEDALAAYRWAHKAAHELGADPERIGVGGDSAGGNLAACTAIAAAREGLPVAFQLLVYPMIDAARATASAELFADGFYLTRRFTELADKSYLAPGQDPRDPGLSPLHAQLPAGLAPAYVATAGFDPLRDEGEAYARKLADAGVTVELERFPGEMHGFLNIVGVGRTSRAAVAQIADRLAAAL